MAGGTGAWAVVTTDALDRLLAPCDRVTFLAEHWERHPHAVHRDDPTYFEDLVSRADVDAIAGTLRNVPASGDQRVLEARLVAHRDGQPSSEPVAAGPDGSPDRSALYRGYAAGATVVLGPLGGRWPSITALCAGLEAALHHPVSAHLYLTPPDAQGFPPHHDTHDVFVVQVEGSKSWRIGPPDRELPLADEAPDTTTMGVPATDIRLDAGDVLYIPRGLGARGTRRSGAVRCTSRSAYGSCGGATWWPTPSRRPRRPTSSCATPSRSPT